MVRYDPTQEEHKKYVKDKPELPKQKRIRKPKQRVEQTKVVDEPVVDTDKYYKVGDKLKDVFSSQNQFSFNSLFPTSDESECIKYCYSQPRKYVYIVDEYWLGTPTDFFHHTS